MVIFRVTALFSALLKVNNLFPLFLGPQVNMITHYFRVTYVNYYSKHALGFVGLGRKVWNAFANLMVRASSVCVCFFAGKVYQRFHSSFYAAVLTLLINRSNNLEC